MTGDRVKCKRCDALILNTTSNRNNGYCRPCYKGRRPHTGVIHPNMFRDFYIDTKTFDTLEEFFRAHGISYIAGNETSDKRTHSGILKIDDNQYYLGISSIDRESDRVEGWVSLLNLRTEEKIKKVSEQLNTIFGEESQILSHNPSVSLSFVVTSLLLYLLYGVILVLAVLGVIFLFDLTS